MLLVRSKPGRPTDAGEAVLRFARQVELLAADTTAELAQAGARPAPLAVAVNADSLATWFLPRSRRWPARPAIELHREDEDHTARLLRAGTVVAAITSDADAGAGLHGHRARDHALPADGLDGVRAPLVPRRADRGGAGRRADDDLRPRRRAADRLPASARPAPPRRRRWCPSSTDFVQAIALGMGWGMVPDLQRPAGPELVELEPGAEVDVALHLQRWRIDTPSLDRLAAAIVAGARERLSR